MSENGGYRRLEVDSVVMCSFCFLRVELRSVGSHFKICPSAIKYVEMCWKSGKDKSGKDKSRNFTSGKDTLDKALVKPGDISICGHCNSSVRVHRMSDHHKRCKKAIKEKEEIEKGEEDKFLKGIACEVCCVVRSCTSVTMYGYLNY
jgi:hypothetical protein